MNLFKLADKSVQTLAQSPDRPSNIFTSGGAEKSGGNLHAHAPRRPIRNDYLLHNFFPVSNMETNVHTFLCAQHATISTAARHMKKRETLALFL